MREDGEIHVKFNGKIQVEKFKWKFREENQHITNFETFQSAVLNR